MRFVRNGVGREGSPVLPSSNKNADERNVKGYGLKLNTPYKKLNDCRWLMVVVIDEFLLIPIVGAIRLENFNVYGNVKCWVCVRTKLLKRETVENIIFCVCTFFNGEINESNQCPMLILRMNTYSDLLLVHMANVHM